MPKPPRFQSDTTRQFVVSMLMVLLLALSLSLAMAFTTRSQRVAASSRQYNASEVTIGPLRFHLPDGWEPLENLPADRRFGNAFTMLVNRDNPDQVLTLALLPVRNLRSPQVALQQAISLIRDEKSASTDLKTFPQGQPFRSRTAVGMTTRVTSPEQERSAHEQLAVITEDGRTYGLLYLVGVASETRDSPGPRKLSRSDIHALAGRVTFKDLTKASDDDLAAADLASLPSMRSPVGLYHPADADNPAIRILPAQGPAGFWQARVRGIALPAEAFDKDQQENQPYSTSSLLKRIAPTSPVDGAQTGQPTAIDLARLHGWKVIRTGPAKDVDLQRELWLVTTRDTTDNSGGAMLVELITEPRIASQAQSLLVSTLLSLQPAPSLRQASHWQSAMERGQAAATTLREDFDKRLDLSPQYWGFYCEGMPMGFVLSQVTTQATPPLSVRGRTLLVHTSQPRFLREEIWSSNTDATLGWLLNRMIVPAADSQSSHVQLAQRLELREGKMAMYDLSTIAASSPTDVSTVPRESKLQWSASVQANDLRWMTLDAWPLEMLQAWPAGQGAVVRFTAGSQPPQPMWMEIIVDQPLSWRVTLRPLAEINALTLRLDERGRVYGAQWYDAGAGGMMPLQFNTQQVDRQAIVKAFGSMEDDIQKWEKEWQPHESLEKNEQPQPR